MSGLICRCPGDGPTTVERRPGPPGLEMVHENCDRCGTTVNFSIGPVEEDEA